MSNYILFFHFRRTEIFLRCTTHLLCFFFRRTNTTHPWFLYPMRPASLPLKWFWLKITKSWVIPTNTYCMLAENQEHFIDKTQEYCDFKNIGKCKSRIGTPQQKYGYNIGYLIKKLCTRWLAFLSKLILYKLLRG